MSSKKLKHKKGSGKKTGSGKKKSSHERKTVITKPQKSTSLLNLGEELWEKVGRQEFLAGRLYPRGSVVITDGETGAKKTWLLMYESWKLSRGLAIRGGCEPDKSRRVIYFHGDLSLEGFKERTFLLGITSKSVSMVDKGMFYAVHRDMLEKHIKKHENIVGQFVLDKDFEKEGKMDVPSEGEKFRQLFEKLLMQYSPDMVVIDPYFGFTCHSASHGQTYTKLIMYLKGLAQKYQACIVIIANQNIRTAKNRKGKITGGANFDNAVPIRETIFKQTEDGDEGKWSYVERLKDSLTEISEEHPARFRFRLQDRKKKDGKYVEKTGTFLVNVDGEMVSEEKQYRVKKVVYDFDCEWPESEAKGEGRAGEVRKAIITVLTENPEGLIGSECFSQVGEFLPGCSNATFLKIKNALLANGVVVAIPTGRNNGRLLRLKKFVK